MMITPLHRFIFEDVDLDNVHHLWILLSPIWLFDSLDLSPGILRVVTRGYMISRVGTLKCRSPD
jgi:hypothetical protein